jgi:hypothetical protein
MAGKTFLAVLGSGFMLAGTPPERLTFEKVWSLSGVAVEAGNNRRGGYSEVSRVALGKGQTVYLKRQHNQLRWSLRCGLTPHPTYWLERDFIDLANRLGGLGPDVLCYGESRQAGEHRALLVLSALDGFCSLDALLQRPLEREDRRACLFNAGDAIRRLHAHRIEHGALYLKHIFAGPAPDRRIRLIDFERSRLRYSERAARRHDLERFFRRAWQLTAWDRTNFEEGYGRHV